MYYTQPELQFDHHLIVLWQLVQFLEGGTLIRFLKLAGWYSYFLGTIIKAHESRIMNRPGVQFWVKATTSHKLNILT